MTVEIELKIELTPEGASAIESSSLLPDSHSISELLSTYYDTPDGVIGKAGMSLRIREANSRLVQTVKSSSACAAGLFVRAEWEKTVGRNWPVLDDNTPIRALLAHKSHKIVPIFEVEVLRKTWLIEDNHSVVEVVLDRGQVMAEDRLMPICEIEFELKSGNPAKLCALARRINAVGLGRVGVLSKAERGYLLRAAVADSVKASPISFGENSTVETVFQHVAAASLRHFRLNEPRLGHQNPDALHQARVALRRLLTAMAVFKPILKDNDLQLIRNNLHWLTGELGKARNLDVVSAQALIQPRDDRLEAARIDAYFRVAEVLASERCRSLMIDLAGWIAIGSWRLNSDVRVKSSVGLEQFADEVLGRLYKKVKKGGDIAALDDSQRHRIRKNAKRLRYASEFFVSLFDKKGERRRYDHFINALERLQNKLGALNDLATLPSVLGQVGLSDSFLAQQTSLNLKKAELLKEASKAQTHFLGTKRFWI